MNLNEGESINIHLSSQFKRGLKDPIICDELLQKNNITSDKAVLIAQSILKGMSK